MSNLKKKIEKKLVRKFYTNSEMKEFNDKLSPFLVEGWLSPIQEMFFFQQMGVAKVHFRFDEKGEKIQIRTASDYDYRIIEDKMGEYDDLAKKLNQWFYWRKGKKIEDEFKKTEEGAQPALFG